MIKAIYMYICLPIQSACPRCSLKVCLLWSDCRVIIRCLSFLVMQRSHATQLAVACLTRQTQQSWNLIALCFFHSTQWGEHSPCMSSFSEQLLSRKQLHINLTRPATSFSWDVQVLVVQVVCNWGSPKHTFVGLFAGLFARPVSTTLMETQYTKAETALGSQGHRCRATCTESQEIICWSLSSTTNRCFALTYEWEPPDLHHVHWVVWKLTFLHFQLHRVLFRWTWTRNKNSFSFLPCICTWEEVNWRGTHHMCMAWESSVSFSRFSL